MRTETGICVVYLYFIRKFEWGQINMVQKTNEMDVQKVVGAKFVRL